MSRLRTWSRDATSALAFGECAGWSYALCTRPRPGADPRDNQDAALAGGLGPLAAFAVADGVGGHRGGATAAKRALRTLAKTMRACTAEAPRSPADVACEVARALLLDNLSARRRQGLTTLTALFVLEDQLAAVHAGDSAFAIFSGTGRIKHRSVAHSPAGYAIEAGRLDERDLLEAEDHHVVSNVLGARPLSLEVTGGIELRPRDTLLVGSDGLFDNFTGPQLASLTANGDLRGAAEGLSLRLDEAVNSVEGKPDDHSFILARRLPPPPRAVRPPKA